MGLNQQDSKQFVIWAPSTALLFRVPTAVACGGRKLQWVPIDAENLTRDVWHAETDQFLHQHAGCKLIAKMVACMRAPGRHFAVSPLSVSGEDSSELSVEDSSSDSDSAGGGMVVSGAAAAVEVVPMAGSLTSLNEWLTAAPAGARAAHYGGRITVQQNGVELQSRQSRQRSQRRVQFAQRQWSWCPRLLQFLRL